VAAACGGNDGENANGEVQEPRDVAPAAQQELVVGVGDDPWLDAETDHKRFPGYPLNADVCETLVQLTPDYQVAPALAEEWEYVGDNTFRFTLKEEPTFSDESPLTADAVKYTMDYTAEEPSIGGDGVGPDSTTVIDERTVEVRLTEPNLRFVEQATHPTYQVLAPGSDPLNDSDVTCTGPFEVVEYVPSERLIVERNDGYWGEPAKLEKITFRFYPDDTTRTLALQNGEVDLITEVPRGILSTVQELPGIETANAPVGATILMYVAQREASGAPRVLSDQRLRRAVSHSMDREAFVNGVLGGNAEIVPTVMPPRVLGEYADLVEGIQYDPEEAARLFDEAGWTIGPDGIRTKDGQPLELDIVYGQSRIDLSTVEFIQAQLREVGVIGNILRLDAGAYSEALDNGTYDLDVSSPNQNDANPAFLMSLRWYTKASGENAQIIAPGSETEFERLIDQTQVATDPDELRRLSAMAGHELVDVEAAGIVLAGTYRILAMKEQVQGLEVHPSGTNQRWHDVFLSE
jgi:peptide/nickel transport system substrate-binding protein